MNDTSPSSRLAISWSSTTLFAIWLLGLLAVLSLVHLPGNWGHFVCGPWGCGPPMQVLLSCHLAWLMILVPLVRVLVLVSRHPSQTRCLLGKLSLTLGILMLVAVIVYQWFSWLPYASDWQQNYFWQRCAFVVATTVDVPMVQLVAVGGFQVFRGSQASCSTEEAGELPQSGRGAT